MTDLLVLKEWLSAVQTLPPPQRERLLLRGSLLTSTLLAQAGRPPGRVPADADYLVLGQFDPAYVLQAVNAALEAAPRLTLLGHEIIWGHTDFPGVRVWLDVLGAEAGVLGVDFAFHDPLSLPPVSLTVLGVEDVLCCPVIDLWGWKLHGLVEFGRGRWRGKDLYDLARLSELPLPAPQLRPAAQLAFASRHDSPELLRDLLERPGWGQSFSTGRKWRSFCRKAGLEADLLTCRELVKEKISGLQLV